MLLETWLTFVPIWAAACLGVGPNSVTCAVAGATNGFHRGMWSALGVTAASFLHSMIAAFGFSSLMLIYSESYTILKWLAVAYLVWLGIRLWRKRTAAFVIEKGEKERRSKLFRRAFVISTSNPQAILTYLAFLTPVINPEAPLMPQLIILVPTAVGIVLVMYTGYVVTGTPLRSFITSAHRLLLLNRVTGSFYLAMAALLASIDTRR